MLYALRGGGIIQADSAEELVMKINEKSIFGRQNDINEYMRIVAFGAIRENNLKIRFDTPESFIEDLIKERFIIPISENEIFPDPTKFR